MQYSAIDIITRSIRYVWDNRRDFTAMAALSVVVMSIASTISVALIADSVAVLRNPGEDIESLADIPQEVLNDLLLASLGNALIGLAAFTTFAVAWHRRVLLGPEPTIGAALRWSKRQWQYYGRMLLLIIQLFALLVVLSLLTSLLIPLPFVLSAVLIVIALVFARTALIFPAIAVDKPITFGASMKLTAKNSWHIFLPVILAPVVIMFMGRVLVTEATLPFDDFLAASMTARLLVGLVAQAFSYIGFAIGITALSIVYRELAP